MAMLGKASIRIEWNEDGKLNVYHGTANQLLASRALDPSTDEDEWDKLWDFLLHDMKLKRTVK